jgi:putative addiction module killer protein
VFQVLHYITPEGKDIIDQWLDCMRDRKALLAILKRIARLEAGNFGDHKFCRKGVWELRVDVGTGYRLYYALSGKQVILLLCGGDKRTQSADITRACMYWQDAQTRMKGASNETRLQKS